MGNPDRRQLNCRIPNDLWDRVDARRINAGLSRDEWLRRALDYVLANTITIPPTASTPDETPK